MTAAMPRLTHVAAGLLGTTPWQRNLALARGVAREREVSIRASIGATRWRLVRQFLTENVLLSTCGGVLGIGIGYVSGANDFFHLRPRPSSTPQLPLLLAHRHLRV